MKPSGSKNPVAYFLGARPDEDEDYEGKPFMGDAGRFVRNHIPKEYRDLIRYGNVIRTSPGNRNPQTIEIECCRPLQVRDIEESRPKAIFGFGDVALRWALGQSGEIKWRGRRVPVKIGDHKCWFYPMLSPDDVLLTMNGRRSSKEAVAFQFDMRRAFDELEDLPPPIIHTKEMALEGIECVDWQQPNAVETIERFLAKAALEKTSGLDWETSKLRPYRDDAIILTAAVSLRDKTLAFPIEHPEAKWTANQLARVHNAVRKYIEAPVKKVAHNEAFEMEWTGVYYGRKLVRANWGCTMAQAAILDERIGGKPDQERESKDTSCLGLGFVTLNRFGLNIKTLSSVNTKNMIAERLSDILPYNGIDAKYSRLLWHEQRGLLKDDNLLDTYNMHVRRIPTVVLTQIKGMPVDFGEARVLKKKLTKKLKVATKEIAEDKYTAAFKTKFKKDFNPGSDADCVKLFRDIIGSRAGETVKGYKVNKDVLGKIKKPIAQKILNWRAPSKLLSTYIWTPEHDFAYPDHKLHPILNTLLTVTGRLSSEEPNEQNFPKRSELGKEIRRQIKCPPGYMLFSVDYAQIEARCIAMMSRDPVYVKMLWENYDVHLDWAQRIAARYPRVLDKYDGNIKELRQKVKGSWVFALFFGASQATGEKQVGVPEGTLTKEYELFWDTFSGVLEWQNSLKKFYEENGYVENPYGRRRRAPISPNQLINAPVQALMGEIVMDGMNSLSEIGDWNLQPIMQVHDDLTSIFPTKSFDYYVQKKLDTLLTKTYDFLNVPLVMEAAVGENLYEMEDAGVFASNTWGK